MYDLAGAVWSVAWSGVPVAQWAPMLLFIALGAGAYVWHHRRLKAIAGQRANKAIQPPAHHLHGDAQIADAALA
jgi:hypothetical protein